MTTTDSGALTPERAALRRLEPVAARRQRLAAGANQWLMTPLGQDIPVVFDFLSPIFFFFRRDIRGKHLRPGAPPQTPPLRGASFFFFFFPEGEGGGEERRRGEGIL